MAKQQNEIKHGCIYLTTEDVYVAIATEKHGLRTMIIPQGELLEFRYFSPAHFRDLNNHYFPIDDKQLDKLEPVAQIWDKVVFANTANLEDILRLRLYDDIGARNLDTWRVNKIYLERANTLKAHFEKLEVYTRV